MWDEIFEKYADIILRIGLMKRTNSSLVGIMPRTIKSLKPSLSTNMSG